MKSSKILFVLSLFFVSSLVFTGCRKKKETVAKIYVKDAANQPVSGAAVTLDVPPSSPNPSQTVNSDLFPMNTTTNSAGEAVFNFDEVYQLGQAGVVVADIKVSAGAGTGQGVIKVEEEKTNEETIFI